MDARRGIGMFAIALIALAVAHQPLSAQRLPQDVVNMGWLRGTVLDDHDQPVGGGEVELSSRENEFTTTVGPNGKFILKVPPDIYTIRVSRPDALLFQRSVLFIAPFSDFYLNVRPVYRSALAPGAPDTAVHYFSFLGPGRMRFGAVVRSVDGGTKMLTFDNLSVYAGSIDCDRRTFVCAVEGSPFIEISSPTGIQLKRAARMELDLRKREIFLYSEDMTEDLSF
jgi:hypothetical protein